MKKKLGSAILIWSVILVLTGCGNALPDMSMEEMDAVGEYAAITLMKYDANHRSRLVDLSKYEETDKKPEQLPQEPSEELEITEPEIGESVEPSEPKEVLPVEPEFASIADFMGLPAGVELDYSSLEVCDSYPESTDNEFFYLEASADRKLIVLKFVLSNQSGSEQSLDLFNSGNKYKLSVGTGYRKSALTTLLVDDMSTYKAKMQNGDTKELVLLFEVEPEYAVPDTEMKLNLKNEANSYTIQLY